MTFRIYLGVVLLACCAPVSAQEKDECELAPGLRATLQYQWRGWHVLHLADLTDEDRNLWTYTRGRVCPGAAQGHYFDANSTAFALALVRGRQETVVAAKQAGGKFQLMLVTPPQRTTRFAVVWTARDPLRDPKQPQALGVEEIGGKVTSYVYDGVRFRRVPMKSDRSR